MEQIKKPISITSVKNLLPKGKVIIPLDVLNKIKYTCSEISAVEWSGVLFYTFEGNITEPETLICTLKDLYVMDKGTGAHTDFKYSEEIINILAHKEELEDCVMSLIHSHNQMNTFFSGEDVDELKINCPNYNQYLSVIVNNKTEICAKVAFLAKTEVKKNFISKFKDSLGIEKLWSREESTDEYTMYTIDMEIIRPEIEPIEQFFVDRVAEIIKQSVKPKYIPPTTTNYYKPKDKTTPYTPYVPNYSGYGNDWEWENEYDRYSGVKKPEILLPYETKSTPLTSDKDKDSIRFLTYLFSYGMTISPRLVDLESEMTDIIKNEDNFNAEYFSTQIEEVFEDALVIVLGQSWTVKEGYALVDEANALLRQKYSYKFKHTSTFIDDFCDFTTECILIFHQV